jgi:hypothetical protein
LRSARPVTTAIAVIVPASAVRIIRILLTEPGSRSQPVAGSPAVSRAKIVSIAAR